MDIDKEIQKKLAGIDKSLVLVLVDAKRYTEANIQILKYLSINKKLPGIYVTVNKPYLTIKKILENVGINTKTIIFIDAISTHTGTQKKEADGCLFLDTPADLTGMSIIITEAVKGLPTKNKFLFFDSLSTLSIHNSAGSVAKFAHFLTARMREWGVVGVIISMEKETNPKLISQLTQFCDSCIELGGEKQWR